MSNAPTESEFDKELGGILSAYASYTHVPKVFKTSAEMDKSEAIAAIKQAVDKHVIGEDDKNYPFSESEIVNIEGYNTLMGGRNLLRREQHVALYGGDKK